MYGRAPTRIYLSAHPVLQIKKRTSRATFASCRPKRHKEEGAPGALVDREFRTSRRALNVLSARAGLPEQATLCLARSPGPSRSYDSAIPPSQPQRTPEPVP